jgi:hypothetical protein
MRGAAQTQGQSYSNCKSEDNPGPVVDFCDMYAEYCAALIVIVSLNLQFPVTNVAALRVWWDVL